MDATPTWVDPGAEGAPSLAQLDWMAANGESRRVHAILRRMEPAERSLCLVPRILRQVLVGGLQRLRALPEEAVEVRREEAAFLRQIVDQFVLASRREGRPPRALFRSLVEWTGYLLSQHRLAEAEARADLALDLGARSFPDLYPRVILQKSAVLSARGDARGARELLRGLYRRRDLISDRKILPELVLALGRASLLVDAVAVSEIKDVLFHGLRAFYPGRCERHAVFDLLRRLHGGTLGALAGDAPLADKLTLAGHAAFFALLPWLGFARGAFERAFLAPLYAGQYLWPGKAEPGGRNPGRGVLVTRAMGGIGDLLMMTPGLHALRERSGEPVSLAVPRRFFPVFEGNSDVRLLDIHDDLSPSSYRRWFNLTDCPAARVESLTAPRVRRGRIEVFARSLGVPRRALRREQRRPRYMVTAAERAFQEEFFARHGLAGRGVVAVQLRAEEGYRDYPHTERLVATLVRALPVLVFDEGPIVGYEIEGVVKVEGLQMRRAFALAAGCSVLVAPDSAFVHLAGALDLPCVALFGPTDGKVRTADYPRCLVLDARRELGCVPCWRNEDLPCGLTGGYHSVCLARIEVERVLAAVQEALARPRPPAPRPGEGG